MGISFQGMMNRFLKQEEDRLQKQIAQHEDFIHRTMLQLGDEADRANQHIETSTARHKSFGSF